MHGGWPSQDSIAAQDVNKDAPPALLPSCPPEPALRHSSCLFPILSSPSWPLSIAPHHAPLTCAMAAHTNRSARRPRSSAVRSSSACACHVMHVCSSSACACHVMHVLNGWTQQRACTNRACTQEEHSEVHRVVLGAHDRAGRGCRAAQEDEDAEQLRRTRMQSSLGGRGCRAA